MFKFLSGLDKSEKFLLGACFFSFFCSGILTLTMGSVLPDLKNYFAISDSFSGIILAGHSAGNLIAGLIGGILPFYIGHKKSVILLFSMASIGMFLLTIPEISFFISAVLLFSGFTMLGVGRGALMNFNARTINILTDGSPAASNLLHALFAVGAIITPVLFIITRNIFGWRIWLYITVIFSVTSLYAFYISKVPEEDDNNHDNNANKNNEIKNNLEFLKSLQFIILSAMMFCYLCSEYAITGWLVTYIQHKNMPDSFSHIMAAMFWGVMLIGRIICASLSSRISQKTLMFISSIGASLFFIGMLFSENIFSVVISVGGLGLCMAGICPMIYSDAAYFTNNYPLAAGALLTIGSIGAVLMPLIVGILADLFGFNGGMSAILISFILLILFAGLNLKFLKIKNAE